MSPGPESTLASPVHLIYLVSSGAYFLVSLHLDLHTAIYSLGLGNPVAGCGLLLTLELPADKEEKHGVGGAQTPSLQGSLHSKLEPYLLSSIQLGTQVFGTRCSLVQWLVQRRKKGKELLLFHIHPQN